MVTFWPVTSHPWETIGPPPLGLFALDQGRAALDLIQLRRRRQLLRTARVGDGHPVLVLPGLLAGDLSTVPLRRFLRALCYDAHGWELGLNMGPTSTLREKLLARFTALTMPTLVVSGGLAPLPTQRICSRLARAIPGATLRTVADAGHMLPFTHFRQLLPLIEAHCGGSKGNRRAGHGSEQLASMPA